MSGRRLVTSPNCQLPKRAVTALEQASVDEILEPGAFTAMGHLPAAGVLADALAYADQLVASIGHGDLASARDKGVLPGAGLMPADAAFLSQVIALLDIAKLHGVSPGAPDEEGPALSALVEDARTRLMERIASWRNEPGRRSEAFRIQTGENGVLWPSFALRVEETEAPGPADPDAFALFAALPLMTPYLAQEEDCFVSPRLE